MTLPTLTPPLDPALAGEVLEILQTEIIIMFPFDKYFQFTLGLVSHVSYIIKSIFFREKAVP